MSIGIQACCSNSWLGVELLLFLRERDLRGEQREGRHECQRALHATGSLPK